MRKRPAYHRTSSVLAMIAEVAVTISFASNACVEQQNAAIIAAGDDELWLPLERVSPLMKVTSQGEINPADCWHQIYSGLEDCCDWKGLANCSGLLSAVVPRWRCLMELAHLLMAYLDLRHRPCSESCRPWSAWFEPGQRCWTEGRAPQSRRCVS